MIIRFFCCSENIIHCTQNYVNEKIHKDEKRYLHIPHFSVEYTHNYEEESE